MKRADRTQPPPLLEKILGALLPPSRREQLLGDLAERYAEVGSVSRPNIQSTRPARRPDLLRYLADAFTTILYIWWSVLSRSLFAPPPRLAGASAATIQQRTQQLDRQMARRGMLCALSFAFVILVHDLWQPIPSSFSSHPVAYLILAAGMAIILFSQPGPRPTYVAKHVILSPIYSRVQLSRAELIESHRSLLASSVRWESTLGRPLFPTAYLSFLAVRFVPAWPPVPAPVAKLAILLQLAMPIYAISFSIARIRISRLQSELDGLGPSDASPLARGQA